MYWLILFYYWLAYPIQTILVIDLSHKVILYSEPQTFLDDCLEIFKYDANYYEGYGGKEAMWFMEAHMGGARANKCVSADARQHLINRESCQAFTSHTMVPRFLACIMGLRETFFGEIPLARTRKIFYHHSHISTSCEKNWSTLYSLFSPFAFN